MCEVISTSPSSLFLESSDNTSNYTPVRRGSTTTRPASIHTSTPETNTPPPSTNLPSAFSSIPTRLSNGSSPRPSSLHASSPSITDNNSPPHTNILRSSAVTINRPPSVHPTTNPPIPFFIGDPPCPPPSKSISPSLRLSSEATTYRPPSAPPSKESPSNDHVTTPVPLCRTHISAPALMERGGNDTDNNSPPPPNNNSLTQSTIREDTGDSIITPNNNKQQQQQQQSITLHDILMDNGLYLLFNNYLQKIHATEALEFWVEVEIFKRLTSERECVKMANAIYKKFMVVDSKSEVNVDSQVRDDINYKLGNQLYDTDLYDKAQECIESTLKFSCVRVFVDEVLPKELRRKSLQEHASEKQRVSLLQRFTAPGPNKSVKKYRDIKQKEDKYIKSITAGRKKKKKEMFRNATEGVISATVCEKEKNEEPQERGKEKRLSGGYGSTNSSDSDSGNKKELSFKKLLPRISNPSKPLKISVDSLSSSTSSLGDDSFSSSPHSPHSPRKCLTPTGSPSPRRAKAFTITKQRSASMLFGLNFLGNSNGSGGSDYGDIELRRSRDSPSFPGLREIEEENERRKLSISQ